MSIVFPVAVLSAELWMTWSLLVLVAENIGDQTVDAYSIIVLLLFFRWLLCIHFVFSMIFQVQLLEF